MRLTLLFFVLGCSRYCPAPPQTVLMESTLANVYHQLRGVAGPTRFAQVDKHLYRGGQPTRAQVAQLHQLGVRTIVSLRSADSAGSDEEAAAKELGMRFERVRISALGQPDGGILRQIVALIKSSPDPVYVHCAQGRDRTSLIVALYRVWVNNWLPRDAWQKEALDYGHYGWWFGGLDQTFAELTGS